VGEKSFALEVNEEHVGGDVEVDVPSWWPHTHGTPHLEPCRLELRLGDEWITVDCGRVGFRDIRLDTAGGQVRFVVNGVPVFCRGACWTTLDILRLRADAGALRRALETARDSGANMLRVGGTMTYESEDFYRLCDELGILVWQDFMFANMDYPVGDPDFRAEVEAEARQVLARLHRHPCIAAYCGGSEVAQQAAMMGLPEKYWSNDFFLETLPRLCDEAQPGVAYFPSSPWGGALPFHVSEGIAHYYGVGAYRRPLADAKSAKVRFATECLGISNVPEQSTMGLVLEGTMPPPHHPRWKARVPRDNGSGYDFEDIRDHYLKALFGEDATDLRAQDVARYYALSRVVSGEVMSQTYGEWRAPSSGCGGALVWFYRDLWPGAGLGHHRQHRRAQGRALVSQARVVTGERAPWSTKASMATPSTPSTRLPSRSRPWSNSRCTRTDVRRPRPRRRRSPSPRAAPSRSRRTACWATSPTPPTHTASVPPNTTPSRHASCARIPEKC
jgi:beta-mannosidase